MGEARDCDEDEGLLRCSMCRRHVPEVVHLPLRAMDDATAAAVVSLLARRALTEGEPPWIGLCELCVRELLAGFGLPCPGVHGLHCAGCCGRRPSPDLAAEA